MRKNNQRIIPKPHAHLHSMQKTSAKFQNNWWKTVRRVSPTRYPVYFHLKCQLNLRFYKSIENLIRPQGLVTQVTDTILPECELIQDFMPVLVTSKFDEVPIKMNKIAWRHQGVRVVRSGRNSNSCEILSLSLLQV